MTGDVDKLLARSRRESGILVRVEATQGSAPREARTWMAVWADGLTATIGGGQLEFQAADEARAGSAGGAAIEGVRRYPLGPSLGAVLRRRCLPVVPAHRRADAKALQSGLLAHLEPVALFGGGHVGTALVRCFHLAFCRAWIDSRDEHLPDDCRPSGTEHSEPVQQAVASWKPVRAC